MDERDALGVRGEGAERGDRAHDTGSDAELHTGSDTEVHTASDTEVHTGSDTRSDTGLLLVGAGGLTREVLQVLRLTGEHERTTVVDDDPARWGSRLDGRPVVGGVDLVGEYDDHRLLVCVGRGAARRALVRRLAALGVTPERYATVVHPRVHVPPGCTVGRGSVLLEGVVMTADVSVGQHVVAMPHVTLTHDDVVGDYATLCAGVALAGGVRVGEAAYLGTNASVREHVTIGPDSQLGMGAALVRDLPAGACWAGVPARPLPARTAPGPADRPGSAGGRR